MGFFELKIAVKVQAYLVNSLSKDSILTARCAVKYNMI